MQEGEEGFWAGAGLARHVGDFAIDLVVSDPQLVELGDFLRLKVLFDQVVQRLLLDRGDVFLSRLQLGHGHDDQHPLAQVEARDDAVVDRGDDAVGHAELGRGRRALGRFFRRRIQGPCRGLRAGLSLRGRRRLGP